MYSTIHLLCIRDQELSVEIVYGSHLHIATTFDLVTFDLNTNKNCDTFPCSINLKANKT